MENEWITITYNVYECLRRRKQPPKKQIQENTWWFHLYKVLSHVKSKHINILGNNLKKQRNDMEIMIMVTWDREGKGWEKGWD